jgi:hypothetical protein
MSKLLPESPKRTAKLVRLEYSSTATRSCSRGLRLYPEC